MKCGSEKNATVDQYLAKIWKKSLLPCLLTHIVVKN